MKDRYIFSLKQLYSFCRAKFWKMLVLAALKRFWVTPEITGWRWFSSPKRDITVLGSDLTSTPVWEDFTTWNDLVLNSMILVSMVIMDVSRWTFQKIILLKNLKSCWSLGVRNECLKDILVSTISSRKLLEWLWTPWVHRKKELRRIKQVHQRSTATPWCNCN